MSIRIHASADQRKTKFVNQIGVNMEQVIIEINVNSKFVHQIGVNMEIVTIEINVIKFRVSASDRSEHGKSNY